MNINLTLLGQAISFAIFVWFCMKFVWPPIIKILEERSVQIADGLTAAEEGQKKLSEAKQALADLVEEGKQKAAEIVNQGQKRHDDLVESAKEDGQAERDKILAAAQAEIDQQRTQIKEQLRSEVANLALVGVEQILMREVDRNAHNDVLTKISADL